MREKVAKLTGSALVSNRELLRNRRKDWQRFGHYSMFAAAPAMIVSHLPGALAKWAPRTETSVTEQPMKDRERLNISVSSSRSFLKRQSGFRLPHQRGSFSILAALSGNDDCPGRLVPGGTYTAAAPYTDSGDTTGANSTISYFFGFYYGYDASGPDNIYSFTLTDRGSNPQIQVSTTSSSYKPLIYILDGSKGPCPAGTGNTSSNVWFSAYADSNGVATLDSSIMQFIPLNVPYHLFVDGVRNDAAGSGPYKLRMQDVTIASESCASANPIDCTDFFVRQQYKDFLNRDPDTAGLTHWTNEITSCGGDAQCTEVKRINASAAFFVSIEFQQTGYLVYKSYAAAFGPTRIGSTVPLTRSEFMPDVQRVGQGVIVGATGWEAQLEANKTAYFNEFVQRQDFAATYPSTMSAFEFVDALNANAGNSLTMAERDQLALDLMGGTKTRAQVLRAVVENEQFTNAHSERAFVLMQYFGYLRRDPNAAPDNSFVGYNYWLDKLEQFGGNYIQAEMVKAFISSMEYRNRFGPS